MNYRFNKIFSFILTLIIFFNFLTINVYAVYDGGGGSWEPVPDESESQLEIIKNNFPSYLQFLLGQVGVVVTGGNAGDVWDNTGEWIENHRSQIYLVEHSGTHERALKIEKSVTDDLIKELKIATKEPDNGGYELLKTVPVNKVSRLYFEDDTAIQSINNLLKDNNGIIGLGYQYGHPTFYKIADNLFYVKKPYSYNYGGTLYTFDSVVTYKNMSSTFTINGYSWYHKEDHVVKGWNDDDLYALSNSYNKSVFTLYDCFSNWVNLREGLNPFSACSGTYLVTNSGASIPVFNTVDDAVAYSVANNLYYTSSDYTGEGKEIIITFEEIDKINDGYYDGMYDLLQKLIEQNGGNGLTPEQLQELVDEVQASFGMLKDEINKGFQQQDILIQKNSSILQNIADALNEFFRQTKDFRNEIYNMLKNVGTGGGTGGSTDNGLLKKIYDTVKDGFGDVVKELKKIKRWTAIDTIIDGADAVVDIIQFITDLLDPDKAADAVAEFVATGMDTFSDVKLLIDGKFPFCIPVDILTLMQTLAHDPEPPRFELPIVLERYGIDEKLVIDLSEFDYISRISRTFLTISWCFALMNVTTKITDMKSI